MKEKVNITTILFNIFETILIVVSAFVHHLDFKDTIIVILTFEISRHKFKLPKHYKNWKKCLIWTLLLVSSLFVVTHINFFLGIAVAVFTSYILSGDSDMYMWTGKTSKYNELIDFVGISPNNKIIQDYEEYWRVNYPLRYEIFRLYFRERKSYEEIRKLKDYDENTRIKEECKTIYSQLERPLGLTPLKK